MVHLRENVDWKATSEQAAWFQAFPPSHLQVAWLLLVSKKQVLPISGQTRDNREMCRLHGRQKRSPNPLGTFVRLRSCQFSFQTAGPQAVEKVLESRVQLAEPREAFLNAKRKMFEC